MMKSTKPTPLLTGLAAIKAEVQARIDRDQAEFDLEDGIVAPQPPADELAAKRARIRPSDAT
jgi:hypothetical protein